MSENPILIKEIMLGNRPLSVETGRVAKQAGGSVLVRYGDTVVLVTATLASHKREGIDFFPLTVDYEERLYAVGKIPGGFIKREGRPGHKAILSGRLIDRPIRPLFPEAMRNEVAVVNTILSVDQDNSPVIAAMIGASTALHISNIPFMGPIGGVIVGRIDGKFVINPTQEQAEKSDMHLVVAGTRDAVMMVEAGAKEVPEEVMLDAIMYGQEMNVEIVDFIEKFREEALTLGLARGKFTPDFPKPDSALVDVVTAPAMAELDQAVRRCVDEKLSKHERDDLLDQVKLGLVQRFLEMYPDDQTGINELVESAEKKVIRRLITKEKTRVDGRAENEVRPITVETGLLPRTHGSGLFTRGQTQVLSVVTLGAVSEEQILDDLGIEATKRFIHHYNFPSFSNGETKPIRTPGRREIGHGALAERALEPMIPKEEDFPYTIRIVSEVLESNGSTSMGSVCGSCLALMDAGVPIKAPVAGVAMGLVKENEDITILTDIQGIEDHLGDMDFKVAGTANGVTALQMDIKIHGVTREVFERALDQAHEGRMHILGKMLNVISGPREELSPFAPRIIHTTIDPDKIRDVIGPGGKIIKKIVEETGADIDIEDDGRVFIAAVDPAKGKHALEIIETITKEVNTGEVYSGRVTRVMDFGCFVEIIPGVLGLPGKEGLVHISQLDYNRVNKVEDICKEGDPITVKAIGYDHQGRLKLSRKDALPPPPPGTIIDRPERPEYGDRSDRGDRGDRQSRPPRRREPSR